jgi:hypothetical protein
MPQAENRDCGFLCTLRATLVWSAQVNTNDSPLLGLVALFASVLGLPADLLCRSDHAAGSFHAFFLDSSIYFTNNYSSHSDLNGKTYIYTIIHLAKWNFNSLFTFFHVKTCLFSETKTLHAKPCLF